MAKVNYFLSFASSILVGPLRLSCCSISPASLPKAKALLPQPSSLGLSCPHSHQISREASTLLALASWRTQGTHLQPLPSVCQRENPPRRPISCPFRLSEDFVGWRLGSLSPFPPSLSPPGCCTLLPQPYFTPLGL